MAWYLDDVGILRKNPALVDVTLTKTGKKRRSG
jgi:hypothetical protein